MKQKATLKQIAKELNVSVSTVSKALSNSPEISEPTKIRVQEFAKLKNYKPNNMAVNLKNKRSKTIGVIIPNILNPFFAKVFSGIEMAANARGYNVITCISNESLEKEIHAMDMLSNGTIDGFILSVSEETQMQQEFKHFKEAMSDDLPIVMFDRISDEVNCDKVIVDDFDSAVHAVNHMIKLNCKNIALVSTIDNLSVGKLRADGYRKALSDNKYQVNEDVILLTDNPEEFDNKLASIFDKNIDGVFALDEHASVMAMKMAIKRGVKIPEELNIIGFADGVWSRRLTPSLSTVSQHGPEIGEAAAEMLINRLESKEEEEPEYVTKVIKTELRQRESTRKL
ncbi:LacI family transcriptional regulator [Flavobacterium arcticum]|uniref:LacI family transcriptional regulator n=1 Tax=Flavobacterium arcticum TaxID=1784713 RepID=A0A345HA10_9FLAO|nr:LacI family DNA-binding transcriptional regulator [Flavobacterium arcticum]AXG73420.1 LacI family transcriptional regulator [Flavobacterium arcticum]KAF2513207.1 LacI family transcriptional regulator [Flavobacterium arcticum]